MTSPNDASPTVETMMIRDVITTPESTPISRASQILGQHNIRHLVVVDTLGIVTGILSERDLFRHIARRVSRGQAICGRLPVSDLMIRNPLTVPKNASLSACAKLLSEKKIGSLPVVDERGRIVGLITRGDILKLVATGVLGFRAQAGEMANCLPRPHRAKTSTEAPALGHVNQSPLAELQW